MYYALECLCLWHAGMLREGAYGAYHQAQKGSQPSSACAPLEFTHVMIDEAGQVCSLISNATGIEV